MTTKPKLKLLPLQTVTITIEELKNTDISTAIEIYEHKLKWDTNLNYRNLHIEFVVETREGTRIIRKSEYLEVKVEWYHKLLHEQPAILYYLVEEDFNLCLYMFIHDFRPLALSYLFKKRYINLNGPVKVDSQLKNYILETIENLSKRKSAPINLMYQVYREVAAI